ncbi:MAG: CotH kinase family protein, partial [Clostridia bacterium]|nr:CotH kinase family protein [Clostridia bacterium]
PLAFDEASSTYCYSISQRIVGKNSRYAFGGTFQEEPMWVIFPQQEIQLDGSYKASANQTLKIRIFTDTYYGDYSLRISIVPVMTVEIENRRTLPNDTETTYNCTITLQNPDADVVGGDAYVASYATVHNRGASAMVYPKKSMKIELQKYVEENGKTLMTERKKRLLGMRDDDDWVLDASYADPTMMHNKLAYNLWEEMGGDTNPDALLAGPNCEYVEVIFNGKYHGVYLLVEPVDEKQTGVEKEENTKDGSHGTLIKTTSWENTRFDAITGFPQKKNGYFAAEWNGFEMKYPKNKIRVDDWDPLYTLLDATANGDNAEFTEAASRYLDKENAVNYWIFVSVLLARDNAGKNLYWSIHNLSDPNGKMYINVWDVDNCFGYRYGIPPIKDPVTTSNYADGFKLLKRYLQLNVDGSADYLKERWAELTAAGGLCSIEGLQNRIDAEADFLESSGAFRREQKRWPASSTHASLPNALTIEVDYAKEWIRDRIPGVDKIVENY